MSVNDLEKFRDEWKAELQNDRDHVSKSEPGSSAQIAISNENLLNASKTDRCINPAYRENTKSHTCLFSNCKPQKDDKTNTKFYPFRIVDNLLSPKDGHESTSISENSQQKLLPPKNHTGKKRKAVNDFKEDWDSLLSSKKVVTENGTSERYLDLFIADLVS